MLNRFLINLDNLFFVIFDKNVIDEDLLVL